ncbi:hypothetical protein ACO0QE_002980 [Hanseniaspora vineae]
MNAFFAQVEQRRLGFDDEAPVVCVQWNSLIAVSYAARKYGINRMDTVDSAKEKCPKVLLCHAAVFKKNEDFWEYKLLGVRLNPMHYKVSLEPYRREGRKILKVFKKYTDLVEKASVDEAFIDLGKLIFKQLLLSGDNDTFKSLKDMFIKGEYNLHDPLPSIEEFDLSCLKIEGNIINPDNQPLLKDWNDVVIAIGSQITSKIRQDVKDTFGYSTSGGVSHSKSISKLASDFLKPDAQTIVFDRLVSDFLDVGEFEITSFWTLGGGRGKELMDLLGLPKDQGHSIKYLRDSWSKQSELRAYLELKYKEYSLFKKYGFHFEECELMSEKLYKMSRGHWKEVVNPKPVVKTMMANKNMRGNSCSELKDCFSWFKVFSGELAGRIVELEKEYNKIIIPKTISVSLRGASKHQFPKHSKSRPFVVSSYGHNNDTDEASDNYIKKLAGDIMTQARRLMEELDNKLKFTIYPLTNLSVGLSNMAIVEAGTTIFDMFKNHTHVDQNGKTQREQPVLTAEETFPSVNQETEQENEAENDNESEDFYYCEKCEKMIDKKLENLSYAEHMDFHYAQELSTGLNGYDKEQDYDKMSYAEKRLLFGSTEKSSNTPRKVAKTSVNKAKPVKNNILDFFSAKRKP